MRNKLTRNLLLTALCSALLLGTGQTGVSAQSAFYTATPTEVAAGAPGSLIRAEKHAVSVGGATKYTVLYRSVGLKGEPIAVSGMVFVPNAAMPSGGWPIVAWGHPTSGLQPKCGPSLAHSGSDQVQGLAALIQQGYVVTATDYPGLGTAGPHPFLVGESEGRAVLDSIRVARELIGGASPYAALWGHSQGGQAVLFAGTQADAYAPEIKLAGVAAAAPATELAQLLDDDIGTAGGKNLLAMTLYAWNKVFDAPITQVVTPTAMKTIDGLADVCLESIIDILPRLEAGQALMKDFLKVDDVTELSPWKELMAANTVGTLPPALPVMLVQGTEDDTVPPSVTESYLTKLCAAGSSVTMLSLPKVGHLTAAKEGAPAFVEWVGLVAAGKSVANDCPPRN